MPATAAYVSGVLVDAKASEDAKQKMKDWLNADNYRSYISLPLLDAFDRLYGYPLFSWRAFLRASIITSFVTVLWTAGQVYRAISGVPELAWNIAQLSFGALIANIVSDYISLLFVRYWLAVANMFPLLASILGALIGGAVVLSVYFGRDILADWWFGFSQFTGRPYADFGGPLWCVFDTNRCPAFRRNSLDLRY